MPGTVISKCLTLILRRTLQERLEAQEASCGWADIKLDLDRLIEVDPEHGGKRFIERSQPKGTCITVFRAARVTPPPNIRNVPLDLKQ